MILALRKFGNSILYLNETNCNTISDIFNSMVIRFRSVNIFLNQPINLQIEKYNKLFYKKEFTLKIARIAKKYIVVSEHTIKTC